MNEIISAAETRLASKYGTPISLIKNEEYITRGSIVVRCSIALPTDAPASVIVKHVLPNPENPAGGQSSFYNEWSACLLLNQIDHDPPLAPHLYLGDRDHSILVMEDLGHGTGPDTLTLLQESDSDRAAQALIEHAGLLGKLHGATAGRADQYQSIREELGAPKLVPELYTSPWPNARRQIPAGREIEHVIHRYQSVREALGLGSGCGDAGAEIEAVILSVEHNPGPFLALGKGDQNLPRDYIRCSSQMRLFDFGESGFRHALIEGQPGRMTWGCIMRISAHVLPDIEAAYRVEFAKYRSEVADDTLFHKAIADAGASWHIFHVVERVATALRGNYQRGPTTLRQQTIAWINAFIDLTEKYNYYSALGRSAGEIAARLYTLWTPEETNLPYYPAFSPIPSVNHEIVKL